MFGGQIGGSPILTEELGAVYVLSLPSFHWIRQPDPLPFGRFGHTCSVIGMRQMVSIGGIVIYNSTDELGAFIGGQADPWVSSAFRSTPYIDWERHAVD